MKSAIALALSVLSLGGGITAAWAQSGPSWHDYPSAGAFNTPSLVPNSAGETSGSQRRMYPRGGAGRTAFSPTPAAAPELNTPAIGGNAHAASVRADDQTAPLPEGQNNSETIDSNTPYAQATEGCWGDDCGCELPGCCTNWYVYGGGLVMTRDNSNAVWTTYESGNNPNQLLNTNDANTDWGGGFEIGFGWNFGGGCDPCNRCNNCGMNSLEASYFGIWGLDGEAALYDAGDNLSTPLRTEGDLEIAGLDAIGFFDNARSHVIRRDDEIHNVELNWIHRPLGYAGYGGGTNVGFLAGVRFFRFDDDLQFGSLAGAAPVDAQFGDDPLDEAFLDVDVENNLVGFQLGGFVDHRCFERWHLFAMPKAGIYGNHMTQNARMYRGDGLNAIFVPSGNEFDLGTSKDSVAFIGSLDVALGYDITPRATAYIGYRAIFVSGVALADSQIPTYLAAEDEWLDIDRNGDLILHGATAGLLYRF